MKKSILTGALALALGTAASSASALTIDVTTMVFGTASAATGFVDTEAMGTTFNGLFFNAPWTATTQAVYTTVGAHTWAGSSEQGDFSYNFTLTSTQVAFGLFFDWSVTREIPVLAIFDCVGIMDGDACTGVSGYAMQIGPFPDQNPTFNGTVSAVPVPAAVWLFGSGLLGLVGVARRRKAA